MSIYWPKTPGNKKFNIFLLPQSEIRGKQTHVKTIHDPAKSDDDSEITDMIKTKKVRPRF